MKVAPSGATRVAKLEFTSGICVCSPAQGGIVTEVFADASSVFYGFDDGHQARSIDLSYSPPIYFSLTPRRSFRLQRLQLYEAPGEKQVQCSP